MANIRCPMCSKVNAPDAQACAFCGARLKPLVPGESAPQSPASRPQDDEPDWLSGLRGSESADSTGGSEASAPGTEANQDADLPDWLARIRGRAQTEGGAETSGPEELFGAQEEAQSSDVPDWLGQQETGSAQVPAWEMGSDDADASDASDTPGDAGDDWLARLQNADAGSSESTNAPDFSSTADFSTGSGASDPGMDWLNQGQLAEQGGETPAFDQESTAEQPAADDWMSAFSSWSPDATQESETPAAEPAGPADELSGLGLTGFFSNLEGGEERSIEPPPAAETELGGFGLTGFLDSMGTGEAQPSEPAPDAQDSLAGFGLTGFLSGLEGGEAQVGTPGEEGTDYSAPAESGTGEALPDWLSGAEPIQSSPEPSVPMGTTGDLSSWLASLEGEQPQEPQAQAEEPAEQLPGWLASAEQSSPAADQQSQPEEYLPGWLNEAPVEPSASQPMPEAAASSEDLPNWMADIEQPSAEAESQALDWLADAEIVEDASAAETDATAAAPEVPSIGAVPASFVDDEDGPAWLRDFASEGAAEAESEIAGVPSMLDAEEHAQLEAEADQPFAVDLPDWLEEDAATPAATAGTSEIGVPSDDLARAELPSWVAAMRPIESAMPGSDVPQDTDQFTEKAGPLSGMRGVLPIPENLLRYRKPPIYSLKLHTTEKQRNQSALLDSIIAQESQPLLIPPARSQAPHLIMRIVIALILVAVITLPNLMQMLGMPFEPLSMPVLQPPELDEMYNQIEQGAQPGEEFTALLAFDYEPGFSGEMRTAASPVISHLMEQNARIVVVSTSPSGPAMADRLLREVAAGTVAYSVDDRTVNLGYLPGGTISLLEFVRQPQFAAPATVTGEDAWQETFLSSIGRFQDFSQVIILTDSAETGRSWVEQVWPQAREVPMFMIASAQAAPMLIPYTSVVDQPNIGQIDGMVSGLMGGAQYGWLAGQPNSPASRYWASYQIGIVLAIVLVLAGGLISGIRSLMTRGNKEGA